MKRDDHGLRYATRAFEAAAWQNGIKVVCACQHSAIHDPHGLWWLCETRGWDDTFGGLAMRFYCLPCHVTRRKKVRPVSIELTTAPSTIQLPLPPERAWKKALARIRS